MKRSLTVWSILGAAKTNGDGLFVKETKRINDGDYNSSGSI